MIFRRNVSANVCQTIQAVKCTGADPGFFFFRRGCTRPLLYFNTNKPQSFFLQNTSCIRKAQDISRGGGGAHSLHPPPRSAPDVVMQNSSKDYPLGQRFKLVHPMDRQKVEVLDFLTFYCNINYV